MAVKPSLALIPSGYKASKVYSVLPSDGVGDFDFSRSGQATRVNKDGLIELVGNNEPRLNYPLIDGVVSGCPSLLLEPQRTNLITNSESLSNFEKTNITEVSGNQVTPDGTLGSIKITPTSSSLAEIQKSSLTIGSAYSISFFVKKSETSHLIINQAGSSATKVSYDIDNLTYIGIAGVDADIVSYGNGWVRIEYSVNSLTYNNIRIILSNGTDVYPYNPPVGDGLYLWGFQLEQNSYSTSYIKTTTSAVTRSAETANNSGDATTFNDSEGVLMAEIQSIANTGASGSIYLGDGGNSNRMQIVLHSDGLIRGFITGANGGVTSVMESNVKNYDSFHKVSLTYNSTKTELWIDGFKLNSDNGDFSFNNGELSTLRFSIGGEIIYGNTKQIQYFDTTLTDTDLEELTSWKSFNEMANAQQYSIL